MTMPAMPTARLAMIEPGLALGGLEAFLDGPAQAGDSGELPQVGRVGTEGDVIGSLFRLGDRLPDQQPMIPRRRLQPEQPNLRPVVEPRPLRAGPGRQAVPVLRRNGVGK